MATIHLGAGRTPFILRIILLIAGVGSIFLSARGFMLALTGETVTASVTNVRVDRDRGNKEENFTTTVFQDYVFTVNGTEYTGSVKSSISDSDGWVRSGSYNVEFDQKFIEEKKAQQTIQVRYLPSDPKVNDAAAHTKDDFRSSALRVGMILLGLLLIFLGVKPNKKIGTTTPGSGSYQYTQNPQVNASVPPRQNAAPAESAPSPKFCAACGAKIIPGSRFCEECGAALQEDNGK